MVAAIGEWHVVFFPAGRHLGPWRILCRRGIGHCVLLGWDARIGMWSYVDWSLKGLMLVSLTGQEAEAVMAQAVEAGGVVVACHRRRMKLQRRIWPLYCVGLAKMVLGIDKFWVLTPYQLYKCLMDMRTEGDF